MPGAFAGHYLDGRSAARQPATIRLTATGLDIALESGATLWWPFAEVRQTQGFYAGQQIRLERGAPLAAVLLVDDVGFLAALHTAAPVLTRRFHDPRRRRARVLAHEIQHVLRRHATRMLLQHTSAGLMLAAVSGDISGAMAYGLESARVLGALRYSRQYEAEADVLGLRMLLAAGVDPEGMIAFFETLRAEEGRQPTPLRYLASHPPAVDRMEILKRLAATAPHRSAPLLPDRDWRDVATLCAGGSR